MRWRAPRKLRFTREGKIFVALTLAIGLGAVNTGSNLLFLLLAAMLSFIIMSGILAEVALRGVEVWRKPPPEIYAARETYITLGVRNRKRNLPSFNIAARESFGRGRLLDSVPFVHVPPGEEREGGYRCIFPRRGRCRFRGYMVETSFPFGLFVKSKEIESAGEAVVYPPIEPVIQPPSVGWAGIAGSPVAQRGGGEEFFALRTFRSGDDPRQMAWKASARRGSLLIRENEREALEAIDIFIANTSDVEGRDADFEEVVGRAASLAYHYIREGYRVGLTALDTHVELGMGRAHLKRLLETLALLWTLSTEVAAEQIGDVPPARSARRVVVASDKTWDLIPPGDVAAMERVEARPEGGE